jgi:signal transduction histidine kinase
MTRTRWVFDRIGGPAAVSWATFWSSLAFNIYVAYWGSFAPTADGVDRLIAVVVSQATLWIFLLLCRQTVLSSIDTRPRPVIVLVCFVLGGIIRAFTVGMLYATVLDVAPLSFAPRGVAGMIFGLVAFVPAALIAGTVRDYRRTRAELLSTRGQLSATGAALVEQMEASDERATERIRTDILSSLSEVEDGVDVRSLERLASEVVRPLSHELAQAVPSWQPPEAVEERVRVSAVLDRADSGTPLMPITTAVVVAFISVVPLWLNETGLLAILFLVGALVVGIVALLGANQVLLALLRGRRWWWRLAIVFLVLSAIGLILGSAAQALLGPGRLSLPWTEAYWALMVLIGLALALAKAAVGELESTLADLRESQELLRWQIARLRMIQWSSRQRLARALHGPVQGAIAASAARLRDGSEPEKQVIAGLSQSLLEALSLHHQRRTFIEGVELLRSNWAGLCAVNLITVRDDLTRLDEDDAACEITIDIVTESVSNAVRHGKATNVTIEVRSEEDRVVVNVVDDGTSTKVSLPGLGTRLLDDCTIEWTRHIGRGSTELQATLPLLTPK